MSERLTRTFESDLYLIRPPPGAAHSPVNPAHIIIAGDSAGGGLSLALLQVIRDAGLPLPAGGVLISPWCDMTHSFSSVHTNTATVCSSFYVSHKGLTFRQDVMPEWGLSLQKPSVLWPPPPDELSNRVHASLRSRIREVFRTDEPYDPTSTMLSMAHSTSAGQPVDVGTTAPLPIADPQHLDQTISLVARSGETLSTCNQLHMYTQNNLLPHPLVSPVMSYLGGLPPLLIIASDKEVLRDEIIYTAHKAADPNKYPIKDSARALYPALKGIEDRHKPTMVHLQVYDDAAHVLPVLFSFTTPAKFCFRAIAAFCKHVTGIPQTPQAPDISSASNSSLADLVRRSSFRRSSSTKTRKGSDTVDTSTPPLSETSKRKSLSRSLSSSISRAIRPRPSFSRAFSEDSARLDPVPPLPLRNGAFASESRPSTPSTPQDSEEYAIVTAGDPRVYGASETSWDGTMIRERISTQGIIRQLETEGELGAMTVEPDVIGRMSELTLRRYLDANAKFEKKFAHTIRNIEKNRRHNLKLAKKDTMRNMAVLHHNLMRDEAGSGTSGSSTPHGIREGLLASPGSWSWAWALDGEERPPPSSIVSRRDTSEARRLANIADQSVLQDDQTLSGNRFWSAVINFLTITPDQDQTPNEAHLVKRPSRLSRFLRREHRGSDAANAPTQIHETQKHEKTPASVDLPVV
ncbi:hypothetical protein DXG01_005002 [Tephrocybe rancida]|nr:hypothetical protein DXG01_005002 [Tephrocybe rancida]